MPAVRSVKTNLGATRRTGRTRVRTHAGASSTASPVSIENAEVTVHRTSFETVQHRKAAIRKLLSIYADTLAKVERLGETFDLVIRVRPDSSEPAVEERPDKGDALDRALSAARERGAVRVADILGSPDMVSARAFGPLIGASHETVNLKRKAGELLALEGATRGQRYPKWQVTHDGRPLPGLAELTRALGGEPWTVYRFLRQSHGELEGRTGLDALKDGRVEDVLAVARGMAEGAFA